MKIISTNLNNFDIMEIVDTHTHLYLDQFDHDFDDTVRRSIDNNITKFVFPSISSKYYNKMIQCKKKYPKNIFLMLGLHPVYVDKNYLQELDFVEKNINTNNFVAVGEIGLDKYWSTEFYEQQIEAFEIQIDLAIKNKLPVIIHCRDAYEDTIDILEKKKNKNLRGIFHCFTGSLGDAQRIINMDFSLGIGGVVTFKNGKIDQFLNKISLENIVLETDSPYLAPVPYRGKRNESSYIIHIVEKLSEIYDLNIDRIIEQTSLNSHKIFNFGAQ